MGKKNRDFIYNGGNSIQTNLYRSPLNRRYLRHINAPEPRIGWGYAVAFIALLIIEILIALYVHDDFVRPYIGDVLVMFVLYTLNRIFIPDDFKILPIVLLLFACIVEGLQYLDIVARLGLEHIEFFKILIGTTGDWKDVVCYTIGCILLILYEILREI
jgi:hypothetical protein